MGLDDDMSDCEKCNGTGFDPMEPIELKNGQHHCEYKDRLGQCWRLVGPKYHYCYGHMRQVKAEKELKGGEFK